MAGYLLCLDTLLSPLFNISILKNMLKLLRSLALVAIFLLTSGLFQPSLAAGSPKTLRLATTTSTENSGLLDYLLPHFETQLGYIVHVVAVGTGKALRMGRDGDADVLLVHAPTAEQRFVEAGFGLKRVPVMYNDFIFVGPESDAANLRQVDTVKEVMQSLIDKQSVFVSRADNSGTHNKEMSLWQLINAEPSGAHYREVGQGMGKVLTMASELDGYTLVDRGTWLAYKGKSPLKLLFEGAPRLQNPYSVIAVNPENHPHLNRDGAQELIDWLTGESAQRLIGDYRINGEILFTPDA